MQEGTLGGRRVTLGRPGPVTGFLIPRLALKVCPRHIPENSVLDFGCTEPSVLLRNAWTSFREVPLPPRLPLLRQKGRIWREPQVHEKRGVTQFLLTPY